MDGLRLALLIAGLAIVVGIALYAWFSRGSRSRRADGLGTLDGDSYLENADFYDPVVSDVIDVVAPDPPVEELGGAFTPKRETSGAELSVDVSVLAGLRATYESTVGGDTVIAENSAADAAPQEFEPAPEASEPAPEASEPAPEASEPAPQAPEPAPQAPEQAPQDLEPAPEAPDIARGDVGAGAASRDAEPLVVDMTRPMVYLMLIAREHTLSGRTILESLDAEGFRPGALQLYYWQSESDPAVVVGVANLVEPGVLDPQSLPDMETPGLVTFMSIPADMPLALKATSEQNGRENDGFHVEVIDTGPGIPAEEREKVFDKFRQLGSVQTRQQGGTGLGLSIASGIVEAHGGKLWVDTGDNGHGCNFQFFIPLEKGKNG